MSTCALLGEAVGTAASLAVKHHCSPHDVYPDHLCELQELLMEGDCFLPHRKRKTGILCQNADLSGHLL